MVVGGGLLVLVERILSVLPYVNCALGGGGWVLGMFGTFLFFFFFMVLSALIIGTYLIILEVVWNPPSSSFFFFFYMRYCVQRTSRSFTHLGVLILRILGSGNLPSSLPLFFFYIIINGIGYPMAVV